MKLNSGAMKGDAVKDVAEHAVPVLRRMLLAIGVAPGDWLFIPKECHRYSGSVKRPAADVIRLGQDNPASRHIDIRVYSATGLYEYSGTLCVPALATGGSLPWGALVASIREFCDITRKTANRGGTNGSIRIIPQVLRAATTAPDTSASPPPDVVAIRQIASRAESMKSGLDTFLTFAKEAEAVAELKAETQARVTRLRAEAGPHFEKAARRCIELDDAKERATIAATTVKSLRSRLAEAERDLAKCEDEERKLTRDYTEAAAKADPLKVELKDAEAQLAECERQEAERAKALSAAPGMAQLLAAFELVSKEPIAALVS
jgi:hypothetical protein